MLLYELYEEVNEFINNSARVFLYGSGYYGAFLLEYIRQKNEVSAFIETKKCEAEKHGVKVFSFSEILDDLNEDDGIILAVSEKYHEEIDVILSSVSCKVLKLTNWKLYELSKFGVYRPKWEDVKNKSIGRDIYENEVSIRKARLEKRRSELLTLQAKYHFGDWHVTTDNAYGDDVAHCIAEIIKSIDQPLVVECGCGLGNIIGNQELVNVRKIAIDRESKVLDADRDIYGNSIEFRKGSFEQVAEKHIDVFISVNFVNSIPPVEVKVIYENLFKDRYIKYYIVDEVTGNYLNHYRFEKLLLDYFKKYCSLGPYASDGGVRYIRVFENTKGEES